MVKGIFLSYDKYDSLDEKKALKSFLADFNKFGEGKTEIKILELKKFSGLLVYDSDNIRKRSKVMTACIRLSNCNDNLANLVADINSLADIVQIISLKRYDYFEDGDLLVTFNASSQKRHFTPEEASRWSLDVLHE